MYRTGKIYKAPYINFDLENKVEIVVTEKIEEPVVQPIEMPDVEAMAADARTKAQANAKNIVDNATNEAGTIIGEARVEAERIKAEAKLAMEQERASVLLEAEKRGYADGHEKGESDAQHIVDEANGIKDETFSEREEAIKRLEPELVELCIRICRKLISDNVRIKPDVVLHLIRQGLAQSNFSGDITLRVSKEDYDNVVSNKEQLLESVEGGAALDIVKDFGLGISDCVIETPFGVIDSSLDMQFEEIRESLRLILEGDLADSAV